MVPVAALHALIEAQARRTPESFAVAYEGRRLTYAELDRRATGLAHHLRRLGLRPDAPAGILIDRSLELMIGILAVLKAGGAYLPMDPGYPQERLAYMLSDSGARVVLTQDALAAKLPESVMRVCVDAFDWQGARPVSQNEAQVCGEHLAYVIYTSGSTGRPKGVGVEHRNIVNYVLGVAERLQLEPGMNHALVSTIAADLGHTVIFPALATGGCLHVMSQARTENQAMLAEYFQAERIDVLKIVPSHLAALQSGANPQRVMPARRLVLGGEASRLDWVQGLRALAPQCEIFNHYGPTETTVGVLAYRLGAELPSTSSGTLPLGRPLPGSHVYLLDERGAPVAHGAKGELCIGGHGVARGYLNRPELTAERFFSDPFSAQPGARLYRTGDLARELPDGNLEFCGRIDHQVKVHGYRVELGEIEGALRGADGVHEAAVLAREDGTGGKQLIAFVSAKPPRHALFSEELSPAALRDHLKARLPQYMVPAAFVILDRLPLNANGKIDRQALAALPSETKAAARAQVAPRTETERTLAAIWGELLGAPVGVDDDVFDLGAHSLMAMKALTRIREAFEVNLALRNLFEHPTIAGLAPLIEALASLAKAPERGGSGREELLL